MTFEEDFHAWLTSVEPHLKATFTVLKKKLSDEPETLIKDLTEAEAWVARTSYILAQANSLLDRGTSHYLPTKSPDLTELDRKSALECNVAPIREMRDKIEALSNALKTRISLGQSLLRWYTSHLVSMGEQERR